MEHQSLSRHKSFLIPSPFSLTLRTHPRPGGLVCILYTPREEVKVSAFPGVRTDSGPRTQHAYPGQECADGHFTSLRGSTKLRAGLFFRVIDLRIHFLLRSISVQSRTKLTSDKATEGHRIKFLTRKPGRSNPMWYSMF